MPVLPMMSEFQGFQTDPPIDDMPRGFARQMKNFLPGGIAPAQGRSGWGWATPALYAPLATKIVKGLVWAPTTLTGGGAIDYTDSLFIFEEIDNDTRCMSDSVLDGSTAPSVIGTISGMQVVAPPIFHSNSNLVIVTPEVSTAGIPAGRGSKAGSVKKVTRAALANLGGSPPPAIRAATWGDYLILANSDANPRRLWFSGVGNAESWPANNSVDMPEEVIAVVPKGTVIFVFGPGYAHILTGDTPPPGGNLSLRKFAFPQGCTDPRATAVYKDYVIWGNAHGIFRSDGSQPTDLTSLGGISSFWRYLCAGQVSWMSFSVYEKYLFATVRTSTVGTRTLLCDLERNAWIEWNPIGAMAYANRPDDVVTGKGRELYFGGDGSAVNRVGKLSQSFVPTTGRSSDPDGAAFSVFLLTGAFRAGTWAYKRFRRVFVTYSFGGATAAGVTLKKTIEPNNLPGDPSAEGQYMTNITGTLLAGSSGKTIRAPKRINAKAKAIQIGLTASGTFDDFRLHAIELEATPLDSARDGDSRA